MYFVSLINQMFFSFSSYGLHIEKQLYVITDIMFLYNMELTQTRTYG